MADELSLDTALAVAKDATQAVVPYLRESFANQASIERSRKDDGELVTNADLEAERIIREILEKAFPNYDILGEEAGLNDQPSNSRWYVDPIDGTGNFARGNPDFAVSIALGEDEVPLVGVIAVPMRNVIYHVVRGRGAFRDRTPIHVNEATELSRARVLWCEGHGPNAMKTAWIRDRITAAGSKCDRIGSAAIECATVAEGGAAAYVTSGIHSWDIAAGVLLVEEAGGRVSDFTGQPFHLSGEDIVASNGRTHEAVLALLDE